MIKNLKRRLVIVNMTVLCSVLLAVLVVIFTAISISEKRQSEMLMNDDFERFSMRDRQRKDIIPPNFNDENNLFSNTILITLNEEREVIDIKYPISTGKIDYQNELIITEEIIDEFFAEDGIIEINSRQYRFNLRKSPMQSFEVILLDRSSEIARLQNMIVLFLGIAIVGFALFYIISILLANWTVRPIATAWEKQKQFVADASHELKTPLTVISTNIDVVESNSGEKVCTQEKWIGYIKNEVQRMSGLVGGLLFLAKSDLDRKQAEKTQIDLSRTIKGVCLVFEPVIFENGKELSINIDEGINCFADGDEVVQLVTILLDNAVKYSSNNAKIKVSLKKEDKKTRLDVENTGSQIHDELKDKIFERFFRADESRNRKTGSFGLGLSIARAIVENHNGSITVLSKNNNTKFTVILP